MADEKRELETIQYLDGLEKPVELPRNVDIQEIHVIPDVAGVTFTGGTAPAYVANSLIDSVRLEYKASLFYDRTGREIREMMELNQKFAPANDFWVIAPESRIKGSEANWMKIRFAALSVVATGSPTAMQMNVAITIIIAKQVFNRILDYRAYFQYAATSGIKQYTIPQRNQTIKGIHLSVVDTTPADPDAVIIIQNLTTGKEYINQTWQQLSRASEALFGVAHNTGLLLVPVNIRQSDKESIVVKLNLRTAGSALNADLLALTQV